MSVRRMQATQAKAVTWRFVQQAVSRRRLYLLWHAQRVPPTLPPVARRHRPLALRAWRMLDIPGRTVALLLHAELLLSSLLLAPRLAMPVPSTLAQVMQQRLLMKLIARLILVTLAKAVRFLHV